MHHLINDIYHNTASDTCSEIATCRELNTFFRAANNDWFSDLTEIATDALKLCRRHFDDAAVVRLLQITIPSIILSSTSMPFSASTLLAGWLLLNSYRKCTLFKWHCHAECCRALYTVQWSQQRPKNRTFCRTSWQKTQDILQDFVNWFQYIC